MIAVSGVLKDKSYTTVTKTRILAGMTHTARQQVVRVDREPQQAPNSHLTRELYLAARNYVHASDALLVSDYGYGAATPAIAIVMLPHFVRLTRAAVIGELAKDYVNASRIAGAGTARLMFDTVLPNCAAPLIVQATLGFSSAILDAAALGFLGLGASDPSTPEWGTMLTDVNDYLQTAVYADLLP